MFKRQNVDKICFILGVMLRIAFGYLITHDYYIVVIAIQIIVGLIVYFTVYRKLIRVYIGDSKWIRVAECFYLFDFFSIYYSCKILTDFLFAQALIVLLYLLAKFWKEEKIRYLTFAGGLSYGKA